ncbi:tetratricopeptide repeat protein [Pontiellaceae bacterium B1224]|nr:tetratricopeptide repeat protein [Pontiellaceae bacterium B1224]
MTATQNQIEAQQDRWAESRRVEELGDFKKAMEIHRTIISEENASYAASLRAGWLYYKLGAYGKALEFYERACALSNDDWALYGIMNCLAALGDDDTLAVVSDAISRAEHSGTKPHL